MNDRAFVKNATERRTALLNKIDAFEKRIAKGDLQGAEESLVHDIRDNVINAVVEVPILATPERTRSALLVQIASIDARLQKRLALAQKRH